MIDHCHHMLTSVESQFNIGVFNETANNPLKMTSTQQMKTAQSTVTLGAGGGGNESLGKAIECLKRCQVLY